MSYQNNLIMQVENEPFNDLICYNIFTYSNYIMQAKIKAAFSVDKIDMNKNWKFWLIKICKIDNTNANKETNDYSMFGAKLEEFESR